ncbi:hypothetical protein BCR34DRAFT_608350 [Clohesyomyces aquaticus]|uniref:Uncharacterized protein n=1 Tax=Clohesyomyces aquaticus TaxID=1231657 RepID=A0A1Y1Y866_9PLEO|nr:hypothetical protein BCR34DRAFT_608350 [Clohesyomyces aquaticus]
MAEAVLDVVGWTYIALAIVWTVLLACGIIFLHLNRHLLCLQIRRLPLVFMAIFSLHLHGVACLFTYILAPVAPCQAEFWIMNVFLHFAALKDFSGENVSFLTYVADWRRAWYSTDCWSPEYKRGQSVAAVRIYASFVSLEFSEFPINISSREMKFLYDVFEDAARKLCRRISFSSSDFVTPFESLPLESGSTTDLRTGLNLETLCHSNLKSVKCMAVLGRDEELTSLNLPEEFTP